MEENNKNGAYVIQEQGDLGLGTTPIDPKYVGKNGNITIPKEKTISTVFADGREEN